MSTTYSIAQRTPRLNALFAGIACAATLALTAGPALASPGNLERVEISGGRVVEAPTRFDVRAGCRNIDQQLQDALQTTWERERRVGHVNVQVVIDGNDATATDVSGMSSIIQRSVRRAVNHLDCGAQKTAGAQIYRFRVDFLDPEAPGHDRQVAQGGVRIALAGD